jgi:hypothetical protein
LPHAHLNGTARAFAGIRALPFLSVATGALRQDQPDLPTVLDNLSRKTARSNV